MDPGLAAQDRFRARARRAAAVALAAGLAGGLAAERGLAQAVSITVSPASLAETAGATEILVTAEFPAIRTIGTTIELSLSGTAGSGDYSTSGNLRVTVPSNARSGTATFTVTPADDRLLEGAETIVISGAGLSRGAAGTGTITLQDDEAAPEVILTATPGTVREDDTAPLQVTVSAKLDPDLALPDEAAVVTLSLGGSASAGDDYSAAWDPTPPRITIPRGQRDGESAVTLTLTPRQDAAREGAETIAVEGAASTGLVVDVRESAFALIDDDSPGLLIEPASIQLSEGGTASYTLALATAPTATVTVTMTTDLAATDLSLDTPVLLFTSLDWNQPRTVTVSAAVDADALHDAAVTLRHAASGGDYAGVTAPPLAVAIVDQTVPLLSVAGGTAQEGGSVDFAVTLSPPSSRTVMVEYATADGTAAAPGDYAPAASSLAFAPGETSKTVTVATVDDRVHEPDETFSLALASPANALIQSGAGAATGTVIDNDPAPTAVILSLSRYSVDESAPATPVIVRAALADSAVQQATEVAVAVTGGTATRGGDYQALGAFTVTIPAGQTTGIAPWWVDPAEDGLADGDETVILTASAAGLEAGTAILTIAGSEPPPPVVSLSISPRSVSEISRQRTLAVTASLNAAVAWTTWVEVSVTGGTAAPGSDYRAVGAFTVTIEAGQTDGTEQLRLEPLDDTVEECEETVVFTGSASGLAPATATLTIADDELSSSDCNAASPSITLWTDRLAYALDDEVRLYFASDPQADLRDYTLFFYLENIETGRRFYFAPRTRSSTLWHEVVDQHGWFEGAWRPARIERVEAELAWQGRAPAPGLWHFVAEARSPGTTQVLKRAHAKFVVPQVGFRLVNRSGTERTLASDTLWTSDLVYYVGDRLYVAPGATLEIEAGTLIRGGGPSAAIIVQEGGRIEVRGRREAPVVMTCGWYPVGQRPPGCWGGLQVRGTAANNGGEDALQASTGQLRYLRVEFAGAGSPDGGPSPALLLDGVGSGTRVDHVQVHASAGDGFSFRGGAVNCTYCVASDVQGKSFSWSLGWQGSVQHLFVRQGAQGAAGIHGSAASDGAPGPMPAFDNVTLVGGYAIGSHPSAAPGTARSIGPGILLEGEAGLRARNLLVTGFGGFAIDGPETGFADGGASVAGAILTGTGYRHARSSQVARQLVPHVEYISRDPELVNIRHEPNPDPRPRSGSVALRLGNPAALPFESEFLRPAPYVGAFHATNWLEEWTFFGPEAAYEVPLD